MIIPNTIWFMDNIYNRLFPPDETVRLVMKPSDLKKHRKRFGLSIEAMAKMFSISAKQYRSFEHHGLHAPDDIEGPFHTMITIIICLLDQIKDDKDLLSKFEYKGKIR